ncbi:MAG: efflux RND transporter periplasmic adaptor subunit [Muribaculaceae bacterium]|nr:efflux RND transporter periplasmic adaptor subunit [Muribaculaceae bacterium]
MKYIFTLAIAALVLGGCHKREKETAQVPEVEVATPIVDSVTLHKTYPGFIRALNSADIVARVNGQLLTQNYHEGDYVTKGQVLFTIESSKYRDAVQQAQAALNTARSQYDYASRQYEAMKKALQADAVSQMDVIQAESSMNTAKASIQNAAAALSTAQENLGYCTVRATRSGRISIATMSTGNYINGEGSPVKLATIYDDEKVKATFEIEASQYELMMGEGNPVENKLLRHIPLSFEQPLPHTYTADLVYTSPNVETNTGTITLDGHLDNPDKELKDGMYVSVDLPYGTDPHAILIRDASIGTDQLGKYVYVVNDSNKVVYTPIEVGQLYQDTLRIVTKGLTPQSRYVTKALLTVRNGMEIKPISAKH